VFLCNSQYACGKGYWAQSWGGWGNLCL
jgi:hypothetical protein